MAISSTNLKFLLLKSDFIFYIHFKNERKNRWGIIGPGRIARAFAEGLVHTSNGKLTAIASRSNERGKKFAEEWEVPNSFDSYQKLAQSSVVDAIYIATPHSEHHDATLLCLKNGKHVLCEKPLAVNANQVLSMTQTARAENQILMEGMWSRFPPLMRKVKDMVDSGMLGEIFLFKQISAFCPKIRIPKPSIQSRFGRRITSGYRDLSSILCFDDFRDSTKTYCTCIHCEN